MILITFVKSVPFEKNCIGYGPSPGFSSRGTKKTKGAKNQKEGHIFKIQYWMYAATGGPNLKCGGTDFK